MPREQRRSTDLATEPLLGNPGDVTQPSDRSVAMNVLYGTAAIAQAGVVVIFLSVWGGILSHDMIFMSSHPLLNSTAFLLLTESVLLLQPTHTPSQKSQGTLWHARINAISLVAFASAFAVIFINKEDHKGPHFVSAHGRAGFVFYIFLLVQAAVGIAQYWMPFLFGGTARAKSVYKYHRVSGYIILGLALVTMCLATQTDYIRNTIKIPLWSVLIGGILVVTGVGPRIKKSKFQFLS